MSLIWDVYWIFVSNFLCLFAGPRLHPQVLFSLPVKGRGSSLTSATARTLGSRVSTSGLTDGSWYVLAGTTRPPAFAAVHPSQVTLTFKAVSPSQRASAVWTTGSPSISPQLKPSPVRRARRRDKGISLQEMDWMVTPWVGALSHWDLPPTKATNVPSPSPVR